MEHLAFRLWEFPVNFPVNVPPDMNFTQPSLGQAFYLIFVRGGPNVVDAEESLGDLMLFYLHDFTLVHDSDFTVAHECLWCVSHLITSSHIRSYKFSKKILWHLITSRYTGCSTNKHHWFCDIFLQRLQSANVGGAGWRNSVWVSVSCDFCGFLFVKIG